MTNLVAAVALLAAAAAGAPASPDPADAAGRVVFVCEHGTVKSVIAAEWFNRRATERGLPFRAVSRGVRPDAAIPPAVQARLAADGFDTARFTPRPLHARDASARVVVAIGTEAGAVAGQARVERWDGVPAASVDYGAARDDLRARIDALLERLAAERR